MDTHTPPAPSIVLVPGHWLGAWAWDAVAADLRTRGHHVIAVTLPGLDPHDPARASATVSKQADALRRAVDTAATRASRVVLVAHSGAALPTSALLDRDPGTVARVVYVDSGPSSDGAAFDDSVPPEVDEVPLPPFEHLPASLEGLSEHDRQRFREQAVPEPAAIMRERVHLLNDTRRDVPSTIIACSYPSAAVRQMAREGHPMMAEVGELRDLEFVDLPTGHWPMWSRPTDLARAISHAANH